MLGASCRSYGYPKKTNQNPIIVICFGFSNEMTIISKQKEERIHDECDLCVRLLSHRIVDGYTYRVCLFIFLTLTTCLHHEGKLSRLFHLSILSHVNVVLLCDL